MTQQNATMTRTRDAAATTARIVRAAEAEFALNGFAGARVDRIADMSGTNKALLFHRFGDKLGLYRAVLERIGADAATTRSAFVSRLAPGPTSAEEFGDVVRALVEVNINFLERNSTASSILRWEQASGWTTFREVWPDSDDVSAAALLRVFETAAELGWIRPEPSPAVQLALTFEVPHAHLTSGTRASTVDLGFLANFVANGLLADATTLGVRR